MSETKRPHATARAWTADEDARMVALILDGYTVQATGRRLGRSSSSVATRLERRHGGATELRRRVHRRR